MSGRPWRPGGRGVAAWARRSVLALVAGLLVAVGIGVAGAQAPPDPVGVPGADAAAPVPAQARLDARRVEIDAIAAALQRQGLSDKHLEELRDRAEQTRAEAADLVQEIAPRLAGAKARLAELGAAPATKPGEPPPPPEPEALRAERDAQAKTVGELDGLSRQAEVIRLTSEEALRAISDRRRDRFTRTLVEQTRSLLAPALWLEAAQGLPRLVTAAGLLLGDWSSLVVARGGPMALLALAAALGFAALLMLPVRRFLMVHAERDARIADPAPLDKAAAAVAIVAVNVLAPLAALGGIYLVVDGFDVAPQRIDDSFAALIGAVTGATLVYGLGRALLSPAKVQWRLVALRDDDAQALMSVVAGAAVLVGIGRFLAGLLDVLAAPVATVIVASGLVALVQAALLMAGARVAGRALAPSDRPGAGPGADGADVRPGLLWRWLLPVAWAVAIVVMAAALFGYVSLARFLARQAIWTGVVLAALYLLLILVDEATTAAFRPTARVGGAVTRSLGLAGRRVEQAGVVLSGVLRLVLFAAAAFFVVTPWGFQSGDIVGGLRTAFFGFTVGGFTFSLATVVGALATFTIGVLATRGVQAWLDQRFLPRTTLDIGLKTSISTGIGYAGVIVAAVVAFGFAGLDLDNLAIVAGALSVGIGFGLQSIVNNFVSGLILLAERPIKTGDRVQIGTDVGYVRKINVRATEIETLDRASLIVPNSALISGTVKNWMHRDPTGQVVLDLGVAYDADPETVRDILLDCAHAHPHVLNTPEPQVFFTNFGESALQFRLVATVGHVDRYFATQSDLRFAVVKRLREARIDIPFAQRDLHIANLDEVGRLLAGVVRPASRGQAPGG